MANLLTETIEILGDNGKSPADVLWCGSLKFGYFTWDDFAQLADIEYDDGFGGQKVARDLLIVGSDFWMARGEYDGSEWWNFLEYPVKPETYNKPQKLVVTEYYGGWRTLVDLNQEDKEGDDDE